MISANEMKVLCFIDRLRKGPLERQTDHGMNACRPNNPQREDSIMKPTMARAAPKPREKKIARS